MVFIHDLTSDTNKVNELFTLFNINSDEVETY